MAFEIQTFDFECNCDRSLFRQMQMWPRSDPTLAEGIIEATVGAVLFPLAFHTLRYETGGREHLKF